MSNVYPRPQAGNPSTSIEEVPVGAKVTNDLLIARKRAVELAWLAIQFEENGLTDADVLEDVQAELRTALSNLQRMEGGEGKRLYPEGNQSQAVAQ